MVLWCGQNRRELETPQDSGDDGGLLENTICTPSPHNPQKHCGSSPTSWNQPFSGPEMILTHTHCSEKGPAQTILTVATQEIQATIGAAGYLLHSH